MGNRVMVTDHAFHRYRERLDPDATMIGIKQEFSQAIPAGKKKRRRMMKQHTLREELWDDPRYNFYLTDAAVFVGYTRERGVIVIVTAWEAGGWTNY